jgi:hypothetical protein
MHQPLPKRLFRILIFKFAPRHSQSFIDIQGNITVKGGQWLPTVRITGTIEWIRKLKKTTEVPKAACESLT